MTINVKIKTLGIFKELLGKRMLTIKLEKDATAKDLVQKIIDTLSKKSKQPTTDSEINNVWLESLILLNGKEISVFSGLETRISDGDEIVLIPVSHGG